MAAAQATEVRPAGAPGTACRLSSHLHVVGVILEPRSRCLLGLGSCFTPGGKVVVAFHVVGTGVRLHHYLNLGLCRGKVHHDTPASTLATL